MIAKGFEAQEFRLASHAARIASLEEEVERLQRKKKRKAVPNPNRKFMTIAEALGASQASGNTITQAHGDETIIRGLKIKRCQQWIPNFSGCKSILERCSLLYSPFRIDIIAQPFLVKLVYKTDRSTIHLWV